MTPKLEEIKAMLASVKKGNVGNSLQVSSYYPYRKISNGQQAIIRFLPDVNADNTFKFYLENRTHWLTIDGKPRNVQCLQQYGEDCPICGISREFYRRGKKSQGKQYYRDVQHVTQALIIEDPLHEHEQQILPVFLNKQLHEAVLSGLREDDFEQWPYEFIGGTNFIIKKHLSGGYSSYTNSKFERRPSDLDEDAISKCSRMMVELKTLIPAMPNLDEFDNLLEQSLQGALKAA